MLSVIVPAYRSAATICDTLEVLYASLDKLGQPYEVLLVPDGRLDDTAVRAAAGFPKARLVEYAAHRGKGYAVRQGIRASTGDVVAYIDADLELHPDGLGGLVALVRAGADAALGSKRHPESQISYPLLRRAQSAAYQGLVRLLFRLPVTDTQTGLKAFRGDLLRSLEPRLSCDGFALDLELLALLQDSGARFGEAPVTLHYRFDTTIGVRAVLGVLADTLRIWQCRRARRRAPAGV